MQRFWSNWLGDVRARPQEIVTPANVDEVIQAIAAARSRHQRVRVLGAGYSWSPLIPLDGCFLSTQRLSRLQGVDRARDRITVEPGMLVRELVDAAARNGMSVKSPPMFLGLSVGGVIATGSHGTGRNVATFGDSVVAIELVTAAGEVLRVDEPGSDLWRAAITNLGTLGVITSVTLQCEPLYNVHENHVEVAISETAALIPAMLRDHEFVTLFWYPSSTRALFKVGTRTALPAVPVAGRVNPTLLDRAGAWAGHLLPGVAKRVPFLSQIVGDRITKGIGTGAQVLSEPYFSHYQQAYPKVISSEFAIPVELAQDAWTWLYMRLMQYWKSGVRPVNLVAHARFTGASEAFLASSAGRETCHLEVLSFRGHGDRQLFQGEFHQKMHGVFEGRAHWGKDMANHFHAARGYGEGLERFLAVRHDLDPEQRFLNPFLRDEVFGLGRRLARKRVSLAAVRAA